jgi:hypothetical protein
MVKHLLKILCVLTFTLRGQSTVPAAREISVSELEFKLSDTVNGAYKPQKNIKHIFIASKFGSPVVEQSKVLDSISGFLITDIVLVYSKYKYSDNFSQSKLNRARWENLLKKYPSLFQSGTTKYGDICQAGFQSDSSARELSHGFFIYFENRADPVERQEEIEKISKMLEKMGVDTSSSGPEEAEKPGEAIVPVSGTFGMAKPAKPLKAKDPKACRQPYYKNGMPDLQAFFRTSIGLSNKQKRNPEDVTAEVNLRLDFRGQIKSAHVMSKDQQFITQIREALARMSLWHPAVINGVAVKTNVKLLLYATPKGLVQVKGGLILVRTLQKCPLTPDEQLFDFGEEKKPVGPLSPFVSNDNTIVKQVSARTKGEDSVLLVVDLTASMGPYIAQVLDLMQDMVYKNDKRILSIALFNDGNGKNDLHKKIGSTGGIIVLQGDITMDVLGDAVMKTMRRGNGGDCMENNIEAVLQGLDVCKSCRTVMLVCDNFATPRDGSLLSQVGRPIHWILCGAYEGINVNYLDLIRANKGILHTMRSQVDNLAKLGNDEVITIDGYKYQLHEGKFRMVTTR